ncbi:MAG: hypothetical protein LBB40_01655 [Holophagales bacterium]|nr:hypothetical protein [Holophagales bacterium]
MDGNFPKNTKILSKLLGISIKKLTVEMSWISDFFKTDPKNSDYFYSPRMRSELDEYEQKVNSCKENGRKGGLAKVANSSSERYSEPLASRQTKNVGSLYQSESESESEIKDTPLPPASGGGLNENEKSANLQENIATSGDLPPKGPKKSTKTKSAESKPPAWAQAFPNEVVTMAKEICAMWPNPKDKDKQPHTQELVPVISAPELAARLHEIYRAGGDLSICKAIAERAVGEWVNGKWIKAPQYFFGSSPQAPWQAYYQAHISNQENSRNPP